MQAITAAQRAALDVCIDAYIAALRPDIRALLAKAEGETDAC